ncbi:MAG TPA: arylsulfatase, partial [Roseimicrobium sp.]|nr:arylsulfatase [Roseimicrobium sp.]
MPTFPFRSLRLVALLGVIASIVSIPSSHGASPPRPNILYILTDDLGYGDVKHLNPDGRIATPNFDRIAKDGMVFTEAHSSSSVCTPTRYGIMTGRYNWRSRLKNGVLGGMSPRLIEPGRMTVASFLKTNGYTTACIGKWHLGMDWALKPGSKPFTDGIEKGEDGWNVDFTQPILNGPNSVGFDYYYGISASLDMVPYAFIENDRVTVVPTEDREFPMMLGRTGGMTRKGPAAKGFDAGEVLPTLTKKAVEYIGGKAKDAKAGKPFFLYLPLASPHTPILPTKAWQGKSGLNPYADFVMQTDSCVGEILNALDKHGLAKDTLVIFTSDNGCSPQAKFEELEAKGHYPSYVFRGTKADIFEGGHHVPFLVRWPAVIKAGRRTDQLTCLTDLMATCADILGVKLPDNAGEDSVSLLPLMRDDIHKPVREAIVHHSINGSFSIRKGPWKLELCADSGGWSIPRPNTPATKDLPPVQYFNFSRDYKESDNLQAQFPEEI